jgi:hypothetical protein
MTTILLLGMDAPLLEGLAQTLAAVGHRPRIATNTSEAAELAAAEPPLVAVVERELGLAHADVLRLPLSPGGAYVFYRVSPDPVAPLPPNIQRVVLADLALPLERNRLVALVQHVAERVAATGRGTRNTPPEHPAITER